MTDIDSSAARLEMNARHYSYDPVLDPVADLIEQGPAAWRDVHPKLQSLASIHLDMRNDYRAAVRAGVIPDDRNEQTYQERR